jgi:hypothetical protein
VRFLEILSKKTLIKRKHEGFKKKKDELWKRRRIDQSR